MTWKTLTGGIQAILVLAGLIALTALAAGINAIDNVILRGIAWVLWAVFMMFVAVTVGLTPYRGQKAKARDVRMELDSLSELRHWADSQNQNPRQYIHLQAGSYEIGETATTANLEVFNGLHDNIDVHSVSGSLYFGMSGVLYGKDSSGEMPVSLKRAERIPRGEKRTVSLLVVVPRDKIRHEKWEFRGSLQMVFFGKSLDMDAQQDGRAPTWDFSKQP